MPRAIVVGGGAAGTSAAFRLQEAGANVLLVERENRLGGRMRTEHVNGFDVDIGAGLLPGTYVALRRLMQDAGLADRLDEVMAPTAVIRDGRMHYLDGKNPVAAVARSGLLSKSTLLKLSKLAFKLLPMRSSLDFENMGRASQYDVETVADYCRREISEEAYEYLVGPIVKTMYSMSPAEASVLDLFWCLNNLMSADSYSIRGGMEAMPTAIGQKLREVRLQTECLGVRETANGVEVTLRGPDGREVTETADVCVIATRAKDVPAIHSGLSAQQRECFEKLRYTATAEIHLMLRATTAERASVVLIPDSADPDIATVSFVHNRGVGRVPAGKGAVSVYFHERWAHQMRDRTDEEVYVEGMKRLHRLFPEIEPLVEGKIVQRWDVVATKSYPGYWKNVDRLFRSIDTGSRIQLAGDYFALACVNTAVTAGEKAAARLIAKGYVR
jgi:oxygen-dependent protoporphyrinogen oxidase